MSARFSPRRRQAQKVRPCAYCGAETTHPFCQGCYALVDPLTKTSMRNLFTLGAPKLALRRVIEKLDEIHGVQRAGEGRAA